MRHRLPALLCFLSAVSVLAALRPLTGLTTAAGNGPVLFFGMSVMSVAYLAALLAARRFPFPALMVLLAGLAFRLPLVGAPPVLSDDVHRYIWDGRVGLAGENPFRHAPSDTALAFLRNPEWQNINNPDLVTIYPPVAQAFFMLAALALPGVTGIKLLLVLVDLLLALLVWRYAASGPGQAWRLVLYWWHPLPILEFAWSGHVDVLGMLLLTGAVAAVSRTRSAGGVDVAEQRRPHELLGAVLLAGSVLVKFISVAAAPFLLGRRWAAAGTVFVLSAAVAYLPFLGSGVDPFGSLGTYAAKWRSNDFLFAFLQRPGTPADQDMRLTEAKLLALAIVVMVAVLAALLRASRPGALLAVMGTAILVSPTVHPWYLAWLIPLLCFRFSPAWLCVTLTALVAYHPLPGFAAGNGWHESTALKGLVIAPFLLLACLEGLRFLGVRRPEPRGEALPS